MDIMIDTDKIDDLARLFRLFSMVPDGLPCIRKTLKESITRRGEEINKASSGTEVGDGEVDVVGNGNGNAAEGSKVKKPRVGASAQIMSLALKWVQDILDLKDKFDHVWKGAFRGDKDLMTAIDGVCRAESLYPAGFN